MRCAYREWLLVHESSEAELTGHLVDDLHVQNEIRSLCTYHKLMAINAVGRCIVSHRITSHLHDHQILIDLGGDGAEEGGELVLTGGDLSVSG